MINELKLNTPQLASKCADPASNEPMFDFLKYKERITTNSCDLAALNDIFGQFLCVQMKNLSSIYIVETYSSFGQGKEKQSDYYQELPSPNLTVFNDRGNTSIHIRKSKLNKHK